MGLECAGNSSSMAVALRRLWGCEGPLCVAGAIILADSLSIVVLRQQELTRPRTNLQSLFKLRAGFWSSVHFQQLGVLVPC